MKNNFKLIPILMCLALSVVSSRVQANEEFIDKSVQDLTLVVGSGIAGAVLGLSTLAFVDEPGDHLKNIVVGGAIGVIVGVGIVAFSQATKTNEIYQGMDLLKEGEEGSNLFALLSWDHFQHNKYARVSQLNQINYSFSF